MNYYRITDEHLSARMDEYMKEAADAEKAADALAASVGGEGFVGSPYADFGGIIALSFKGKAPHFFRSAGEDGGVKYYEPAVTETVTVETEGAVRGMDRLQNSRCWYDYHKISLQQARTRISYVRAIELAGIQWEGTNIMELSRKHRVSPAWIKVYGEKKMSYAALVAKSSHEGLRLSGQEAFDKSLAEALRLEELLDEALSSVQLYWVRKVTGHRKAVDFVKKANALPTIPSGRLVSLLGVSFDKGVEVCSPAFFKSDGKWYVGTSGSIEGHLVEIIPELDFNFAKMKRGEN